MKHLSGFNLKKVSFLLLLASITALIYACGGGGSGGSSSGAVGGTLFITDDVTTDYQQIIVTIYKVEFEKVSDGTKVTVFNDPQGVTYDLSEFSGIMTKLPGATIPAGSYSKVFVTVGDTLVLVDNAGAALSPNPGFDPNDASTTCASGQCVIEIASSSSVVNNQTVILDFDLKRFVYDQPNNLVTAKVVLDSDGSDHSDYMEMDTDDSELEGIVDSTGTGNFVITVLKAEHFMPASNKVTVNVSGSTQYKCDDNNQNCGISSFSDLQAGMRVEIYGSLNGSDYDATSVELDNDNDMVSVKCTTPARSINDYTDLAVQPKIKALSYTVNSGNASLTVSSKTILITKETVIKDETAGSEMIICDNQIPGNATEVEIKYYTGQDNLNTPVNIAFKIELEN